MSEHQHDNLVHLLGPLPPQPPEPGGDHPDGRIPQEYLEARAGATPHGGWKWEVEQERQQGLVAPGWQWLYQQGIVPSSDPVRYAAGCQGYKLALIANGYGTGIVVTVAAWGDAVTRRTREFQESVGLEPDGTVGPTTARYLLRTWVHTWETRYAIPNHLLGRQGTAESNNHVVAEGWADKLDEGWGQINLGYHPDITEAQAWDPSYAIKFTAGQLWSNHMHLGDWDAALAAYNTGYSTAKLWLAAGKPSSGGAIWAGGIDSFTRAYQYVELVHAQPY